MLVIVEAKVGIVLRFDLIKALVCIVYLLGRAHCVRAALLIALVCHLLAHALQLPGTHARGGFAGKPQQQGTGQAGHDTRAAPPGLRVWHAADGARARAARGAGARGRAQLTRASVMSSSSSSVFSTRLSISSVMSLRSLIRGAVTPRRAGRDAVAAARGRSPGTRSAPGATKASPSGARDSASAATRAPCAGAQTTPSLPATHDPPHTARERARCTLRLLLRAHLLQHSCPLWRPP